MTNDTKDLSVDSYSARVTSVFDSKNDCDLESMMKGKNITISIVLV